jgi:hypothetical protein
MRDFPQFRNQPTRKNRYALRNPNHEIRNRHDRSAPIKRWDLLAAAARAAFLGATGGPGDLGAELAGCCLDGGRRCRASGGRPAFPGFDSAEAWPKKHELPARLVPAARPNRRECIGAALVRLPVTGQDHADSSDFRFSRTFDDRAPARRPAQALGHTPITRR